MLDWLRRLYQPEITDPRADPAELARIGRAVRERLSANPAARAIGGRKADLFLLPGLLDPADCAALVARIEGAIRPSTLYTQGAAERVRTSSTHYFEDRDPLVEKLALKLDATLGLARSHAETLQGQRYRPGEEYRHHHDFFRMERAHWQDERRRGGQRSWSAMLYLNAVEDGGETDFPELGQRIVPEPGLLVVWNNMDRRGYPNRYTRHAGLPVRHGVKYVITQWYRMGEWSRTPR